ncbi:hypothetical protein PFICI_01139 [Pestalotiopsis fici W106-1]|uniref:Ubiquitin 3 binding protein But2 C-terminal domain-containing protein n=1 Tax=Pestalotiopsis fici (strain W106-1 / CGMCC3.15140) TaxID=1229662 RepID=W3XPZ8_PESFW|nr:uncharacterized protein PFICI_01139 [Pestalotiopsis fici W106-1]ETS87311.1 hypothetical protein PFICI_01139 [Pestalotiopsis fici W106-1]
MIKINYILAALGIACYGAYASSHHEPKPAAARREQHPTRISRIRRSSSNIDLFSETSSFTIVNQHSSAVKVMMTRGCDGRPGGAGWSPFPLEITSDGIEYHIFPPSSFGRAGGSCSNPEQSVHLDLGEIQSDDSLDFVVPVGWHGKVSFAGAEYEMTGMNETLLEGSFGFQSNGYGYENLKLDFDVSFVDGFTLPLTCSCGGPVLAGCSWDLLEMSECP